MILAAVRAFDLRMATLLTLYLTDRACVVPCFMFLCTYRTLGPIPAVFGDVFVFVAFLTLDCFFHPLRYLAQCTGNADSLCDCL
jgi:hypothetical protein